MRNRFRKTVTVRKRKNLSAKGDVTMKPARICLVALGANQPSEGRSLAQTLRAALERLGASLETQITPSRLYRTPCFPAGAGPDYLNAAIRLMHHGSPKEMLDLLHRIEVEFGRERVQRWGSRTLDLDLIAHGDTVLPDLATQAEWRNLPVDQQIARSPDQLVLPHPRVQDRAFVLVPLADVAADWVHPCIGQSVLEMLSRLPEADRAAIIPLEEA